MADTCGVACSHMLTGIPLISKICDKVLHMHKFLCYDNDNKFTMKVKPRTCNQQDLNSLFVSKDSYIKSVQRQKRKAVVKLHLKRKRLLSQSEFELLNGRDCEVVLKDVMLKDEKKPPLEKIAEVAEIAETKIITPQPVLTAFQIYEAEQAETENVVEKQTTKTTTKQKPKPKKRKATPEPLSSKPKSLNETINKNLQFKNDKVGIQTFSFHISPTLELLSSNQDCNFTVIKVDPELSEAVVIAKPGCEKLNFLGIAVIELICGQISIHGHSLKSGIPTKMYSPVTHALLTLQINKSCENFCSKDSLQHRLPNNIWEEFEKYVDNHCAIFMLKDLEYVTLPGYSSIYNPSSNFGRSSFSSKQQITKKLWVVEARGGFKELESYAAMKNELLEVVMQNEIFPIILTVGGKNTGKSTFNRYLINSLLSQVKCVSYLECDVGQSEFTPSGMISINKISSPLLGPPHTHCDTPEYASFFGYSSVAAIYTNTCSIYDPAAGRIIDFPDEYITCVTHACRKHDSRSSPLIINTMGWNKGLGISLLMDIIKIIKPTHVIQFETNFANRNFPSLISSEFVNTYPAWSLHQSYNHFHKLTMFNVPAYMDNSVNMISAPALRELMMLAYLEKFVDSPYMMDISNLGHRAPLVKKLCRMNPYKISADVVEIKCLSAIGKLSQNELLSVLNCSLIGLCIKNASEEGAMECLGLGLVRGVKPVERQIYILSGLNRIEIQRVNCLVHAGIPLPKNLILQQNGIFNNTALPYCALDTSKTVLGSSKFKSYRQFQPLNV